MVFFVLQVFSSSFVRLLVCSVLSMDLSYLKLFEHYCFIKLSCAQFHATFLSACLNLEILSNSLTIRLYYVFTCIYFLLIKKDICDRRNISIKFQCVCVCLSSGDFFIFRLEFSLCFPIFCLIGFIKHTSDPTIYIAVSITVAKV
jgi:hypothetical protein